MTAAALQLIIQLAPIASKWGADIAAAIVDAIHTATGVSKDEIIAVFEPFRKYYALAVFEAEAGVKPNPDGSVSPQGGS